MNWMLIEEKGTNMWTTISNKYKSYTRMKK